MKATGIVRRIDDLGRVVVPKEIRRTLRIREGDPLEIYTDQEGEIILKKFSILGELGKFAQQYADTLAQTTGYLTAVSDRNRIIAASSGAKKELMGQTLSKELEQLIDQRDTVVAKAGSADYLPVCENEISYGWQVISPIIANGDAVGAVMLFERSQKDSMGEKERLLTATAAAFLGRQMES